MLNTLSVGWKDLVSLSEMAADMERNFIERVESLLNRAFQVSSCDGCIPNAAK